MKNRSSSAESPTQIVDNLRSLITEAEQVLAQSAGEQAEETLASIKQRLETARDRVNEMYAEAREKVVAGAKQADQTIRSHPYESLAIALGVGVLLGAVLRRNN